jgi:medium-chain acyl-[acyl-carrier-protein] hydrolase
MRDLTQNPWFAYANLRPRARVRLFCLPSAGAGAIVYRHWADFLPAFIELCPVQLPGRGTRSCEPPIVSMNLLVDVLNKEIAAYCNKPFAFFGHSMGAVISFEVVHKLRSAGCREPVHLFLSGRQAPQIPRRGELTFNLSEADFVARLRRLKGMQESVFESRELLDFLLPLLRADFELVETYEYIPKPKLTCPITVFGGLSDQEVNAHDLQAWHNQSCGPFQMHMFAGDHFFLHYETKMLIHRIVEQLRAFET